MRINIEDLRQINASKINSDQPDLLRVMSRRLWKARKASGYRRIAPARTQHSRKGFAVWEDLNPTFCQLVHDERKRPIRIRKRFFSGHGRVRHVGQHGRAQENPAGQLGVNIQSFFKVRFRSGLASDQADEQNDERTVHSFRAILR